MDWLRDFIREHLDQLQGRAFRVFMVNFQPLVLGNDGGPHIVMGESLADFPPLAQEADGAVGGNAPDKVQPPGGEGNQLWQGPDLLGRQAAALDPALRPRRGQALQGRRGIGVRIPLSKPGASAYDVSERPKVVPVPETLCPQAIDTLHQAVALWFMRGRKDQFDAEVQTEPDKGTKAAGQTLAPAKRRVIIELQAVRQAQSLPGSEDMAEERGHGFIGTEIGRAS